MNDVVEILKDGVSGINPVSADACMVVGICTKGVVGQPYFLGPSSNIKQILGTGPLVDRCYDIFSEAGQNASIIAVPVLAETQSTVSVEKNREDAPDPTFSLQPISGFEMDIKFIQPGGTGQILPSEKWAYVRQKSSMLYSGWLDGIDFTNGVLILEYGLEDLKVFGFNREGKIFQLEEGVDFAITEITTGVPKTMVALTNNTRVFPQVYAPEVDLSKCTGCGDCVDECPESVLELSAYGKAEPIYPDKCLGPSCWKCVTVCKENAFTFNKLTVSYRYPIDDDQTTVEDPIIGEGNWNVATYALSFDGATWTQEKTLPIDGCINIQEYGLSINFPDSPLIQSGDRYKVIVTEAYPTTSRVLQAINEPLQRFDVNFVVLAGKTTAVDWASYEALAQSLWDKHRPTFFLCETRIPEKNELIDNWIQELVLERENAAYPFVSVCAAYGNITGLSGTHYRNMIGLLAGRLLKIPVHRAIGRVLDGAISSVTLLQEYTSAHQDILEKAGYITAKRYAGLSGVYFGDARTLADDISDYRYVEINRTVFKAVRLARIAALRSMYNEAGDPLLQSNASGLNYLKATIESALDVMVKSVPSELVSYVVSIPDGQDIVNNGVSVDLTLVGIPIIRKIQLYFSYAYAGTTFDPRMREVS